VQRRCPVRLKALPYALVRRLRREGGGTAGGTSTVNRIAAFSSDDEAEPNSTCG
jgi:hypothetical protein